MSRSFRHLLIGSPLPTQGAYAERLDKVRALAVFSPDALSSVAYANQEIFLGLALAGSTALLFSFPLALTIVGLLGILALSYFQTIHAYPTGGGSYTVARENIGIGFGLLAAAALLVDYLLTAAVSLTAAVAAISSAFPALWEYRVLLALGLLLLIAWINLRGTRESGLLIAIPVYGFLIPFGSMLLFGLVQALRGELVQTTYPPISATEPLTAFLILHTFATGCTALTGIEAISNGVPTFRSPEAKNAGRTLMVMALIMAFLFLCSVGLSQYLGVVATPQETILSALARRIVGGGFAYLLIQFVTMGILVVAANTSFAGFPRVASILASERYFPRQFLALGDRLVFSTGIGALTLATGLLIVIFNGDTHALVALFAVGAFMAFTLSQTGMVFHWWRSREPGWRLKLIINAIGAAITFVTLLIVSVTKFAEGAWISLVLIGLLILLFRQINGHYTEIAKELSVQGITTSVDGPTSIRVVVPISGVHRGVIEAINYARLISSQVAGVYVELEPGAANSVHDKWVKWFPDIPLDIVPSPYRSFVRPFIDYLDETDAQLQDGQVAAVLIPEFVPAKWWHGFLHNQTAWLLKVALLYRRRRLGYQRMIIDVPIHLKQ